MNVIRACMVKFTLPKSIGYFNTTVRNHFTITRCGKYPKDKKPCFNIKNITLVLGNQSHAKYIRSFLCSHYWSREPSVVGVWMNPRSPYLQILTEKYAKSGYRLLAFERLERTKEQKLVGVSISYKTYPWMIDELEDWAHNTHSTPEQTRMYLMAHCFRSPDLFKKYNVDYIYNIEILGTAPEIAGQGVAKLLLQKTLDQAEELRFPLVQFISVNHYTTKICRKLGLKEEWSMDYSEFVNHFGKSLFYPRTPHVTVTIFTKYANPKEGGVIPCKIGNP